MSSETRASVTVLLTNPESGDVSETKGTVSASEWDAFDRILCGTGAVHTAAPDMLAALERIATVDMGGGFLGALACRQVAQAAIRKALNPSDTEVGG